MYIYISTVSFPCNWTQISEHLLFCIYSLHITFSRFSTIYFTFLLVIFLKGKKRSLVLYLKSTRLVVTVQEKKKNSREENKKEYCNYVKGLG